MTSLNRSLEINRLVPQIDYSNPHSDIRFERVNFEDLAEYYDPERASETRSVYPDCRERLPKLRCLKEYRVALEIRKKKEEAKISMLNNKINQHQKGQGVSGVLE